MAEKTTFNVLRRHEGDKLYDQGDTRDAVLVDVAHLVANGVLEKAAPQVKNKAAPAVVNKADPLDHDGNGRRGGVKKAG